MDHIAIDLGGRESQICARDSAGMVIDEQRVGTLSLGRYLKERPPSRVIVETCAEAFSVADEARGLGHDVRVVPAKLAPVLGVGARKTKTDRRDAQVLSEVSTRIELPSVHIPSKNSRERKPLCAARDSMVRARTQLINHVRGWLRRQRLRVATGKTETFVGRIRKLKVELPPHIEPVLRAIDSLNEQFEELDKQVVRRANKHPVCRRLMTIPGVGPVTALRFVATVDKVSRFEDARKLEAYLGLTPGEDSSSERKRRTSITKAGPAAMRWTLLQAAWAAQRQKGNHPMLAWMQNVRQRRGAQVATVALARKIAGIMYALWRDKTTYKPMRAALTPVA